MQSIQHAWHRIVARSAFLNRFYAKIGQTGAVAIITAIACPVLLSIVGFACDYGYASYINQRLARATDSATLGSVSQTAATTAGGYAATSAMQAIGVNIFNANVSDLSLTGVNFSLSVVSDGAGGVIATGNYTYNTPTFFAGVLGFNQIPMSGTAKTTARPVVYVNYYILVDVSQSMGIASTPADMTKLYNAVAAANILTGQQGCVFGCHALGAGQLITNYQVARNNNVVLRIDAAVTALKSIITSAQSIAGATQNIKFGIYTIQANPSDNTKIHTVATPSTNYASLQNAVSTIDIGPNNSTGVGDTDYPNELIAFNSILTQANVIANGSGASATSPLNYIVLITDGVVDTFGLFCTYGHCTGPIDPSNCNPLKSKGTVGIIYTTYATIWTNNNPGGGVPELTYSLLVQPFANQIQPALQSCVTSTDFFFPANDGPDIIAAAQSLFQRTQPSSARITR